MIEYLRLMQMTPEDTRGRPLPDFDYSRTISAGKEAAALSSVVHAVKRQLSKGEYHKPDEENNMLYRKQNNPDHVTNEDGDEELIEHGDFMTLLRNAIYIKLSEQIGFQIRNFISSDQKKIFTVVFCNVFNMRCQNELLGTNKQLEESCYDLFSYEPVDKDCRPLRMNTALAPNFEDEMGTKLPGQYKGSDWQKLKIKILQLTSEIKFKKIGNEVNQTLPG